MFLNLAKIFYSLGDYKESEQYLKYCQKYINSEDYDFVDDIDDSNQEESMYDETYIDNYRSKLIFVFVVILIGVIIIGFGLGYFNNL